MLESATTFDLYILDAAKSFYNYHEKKANGQVAENFSVDEMAEMIKKVRD